MRQGFFERGGGDAHVGQIDQIDHDICRSCAVDPKYPAVERCCAGSVICIVQIHPRKDVLGNADYTAPTGQQKADRSCTVMMCTWLPVRSETTLCLSGMMGGGNVSRIASLQVTIKTNLLAELKHQAPNQISNSSDRELPRDMFRFKTVWNYLG